MLQVQVERLTLKAPMTGVVLKRSIEPGEVVLPGASLLKIGDLTNLYIVVYVSESRYGEIKLGQVAQVKVDSFPGETFTGKVAHIADQAEFTPRNVQTAEGRATTVFAVRLDVTNVDGKLKPGMPADVVFSQVTHNAVGSYRRGRTGDNRVNIRGGISIQPARGEGSAGGGLAERGGARRRGGTGANGGYARGGAGGGGNPGGAGPRGGGEGGGGGGVTLGWGGARGGGRRPAGAACGGQGGPGTGWRRGEAMGGGRGSEGTRGGPYFVNRAMMAYSCYCFARYAVRCGGILQVGGSRAPRGGVPAAGRAARR